MITRSGINVKDLKSMPLPKIECLVTFDFEENHDKKEIEKILNKKCLFSTIKDEAEKVSENDNPTGYIAFDFGKTQSLDGESLVYNAVNYLYDRKDKLLPIINDLKGTISIIFSVSLTSFNTPCMVIDNGIIKKMAELNIQLDQGVDFYSYYDFWETISKFEYKDIED